jgi:hypothetical protein
MRSIKRVLGLLATLSVAAMMIGTSPAGATTATQTTTTLSTDAQWILGAQRTDGSVANYPGGTTVAPYQANLAVEGLGRATAASGDTTYSGAAWRWLTWYQGHMDATGFVTDYKMVNGAWASTGDMDSTDSYAGTFLSATLETYNGDHNLTTLRTLAPGIAKAVNAIEATQDTDGMTWAKPSWHVKYLMDQSETYAGLQAAATLAGILGDSTLQQRASGDASRLKSGVDTLWDPATGSYDWAKHGDGAQQTTNWSILYPDAMQQAWAVAFGLTDATRGQQLMAKFAASQPNWAQPQATAQYDTGTLPVGYWAPAGWAFARIGQTSVADAAATSIRAAADSVNRAWPFTPADDGELIILSNRYSTTSTTPTTTVSTMPKIRLPKNHRRG